MPWPSEPVILGKRVTRVDGMPKATGKAKYPSDVRPEGLLFGVVLYSPHAAAKIKAIDASAAEKMPGVKAVHLFLGPGASVRFQGDDVAAVAAETEEQARDAVAAIKVQYDVLPHAVTEAQAMREGAPKVMGSRANYTPARAREDGDVAGALAKADAKVTASYSAPTITHVCLESHGLTAQLKDGKLTLWASTQNVAGVASAFVGERFNLTAGDVVCYTDYMGGGFGSKFGPDSWGFAAVELSRKSGGRPVRVFLDREQEHLAGGSRPSVFGKVTIGGSKDGKVTAFEAECYGTGGVAGGASVLLPYVYEVANKKIANSEVATNCGGARAMRAPRHPQSCIVTEAAMDDLAEALGVDPLELRVKNLSANDPVAGGVNRTDMYRDQMKIGSELIGWSKNYRSRAENAKAKGPIKRGIGMGLHQWGGGGAPGKQVTCEIHPDGTVEMRSATQDLGTGIRTLLAMIGAEVLGLKTEQVTSKIGNSTYPPGQASGGSTTTPSMAPPAYDAVQEARDKFFAKIAPSLQADPEDLSLKGGALWIKGQRAMDWKDACRKLGMSKISVTTDSKNMRQLASTGVGGAQFATVAVDVETGVVKLEKIVAIQDSGLILDLMTWESQVYGGVIGGINYGLFEERVMDEATGAMLNADMEMYKLARAGDIPEIIVKAYDTPEMRARGVIGVGEPPTISTAAAIGNAVSNAIGVRVPVWPMSPINVLNALALANHAQS